MKSRVVVVEVWRNLTCIKEKPWRSARLESLNAVTNSGRDVSRITVKSFRAEICAGPLGQMFLGFVFFREGSSCSSQSRNSICRAAVFF